MNYTRTQSSNKLAKAIAILGASAVLSCSAVLSFFSQSAMAEQVPSESGQLLAQTDGRGGSDGLDGVSPSNMETMDSSPSNTGDVEDRQELSPRLSDDPTDPVNRQEGGFNTGDVEDRQELPLA